MDFVEDVKVRSERFARRLETHYPETEEATKNFFVMPFLQMMGYNPFEPMDVMPEFTADLGTKKGEKVDYALLHDGVPSILVECKKAGSTFGEAELTQLMRYFHVTDARFGILTDGLVYRFYSDLEDQNMMDAEPFFTFNMMEFAEQDIETLKAFTKDEFQVGKALPAARKTKYMSAIEEVMQACFVDPPEEYLAFMRGMIYDGRQTSSVRAELDPLIRQVSKRFVDKEVEKRIKPLLSARKESEQEPKEEPLETDDTDADTDDAESIPGELAVLEKVRELLSDVIEPERLSAVPSRHRGKGNLCSAIKVGGRVVC